MTHGIQKPKKKGKNFFRANPEKNALISILRSFSLPSKLRYFVVNHEGNPDTRWWNSKENEAAYIDFTKPEAAEWYAQRLKKLQEEAGIDSYKFDAGETSWVPAVSASLQLRTF